MMTLNRQTGAAIRCLGLLAIGLVSPGEAFAQLDPLLFLKDSRTKPNVVIAIDMSTRMQADADANYHDPRAYRTTGAGWEVTLGINGGNTGTTYRRVFANLRQADGSAAPLLATRISIVGDLQPRYATLDAATRLSVARRALAEVVRSNGSVVRFGLVRMRQDEPSLPAEPAADVLIEDPNQAAPSEAGVPGLWCIVRPQVGAANGSIVTAAPALVSAETAGSEQAMLTILGKRVDEPGALLPAGRDPPGGQDAPLDHLLQDARSEAARLIGLDGPAACRNTVVILVTGGAEGTTANRPDPVARAASFLQVSGHRVPLYIAAVAPAAADAAQLRAIAGSGGGQYAEITKAMIDAADSDGLVPELARALNCAIQHALAAASDVNTQPDVGRPYGPVTWHQVPAPVVGTIDLRGAAGRGGAALPDTLITSPTSGAEIPQRSNVMVTAGFGVPGAIGTAGFPGVVSAFRLYRPVADATRPSGYRFVADGTPLWNASLPPADARNIFTVGPDGTMIPFTASNAAVLGQWLDVRDPVALIDEVRRGPLGAVVDSTPAILNPPSLDPPPDPAYPAFAAANAGRRALVLVGANDGMLHAFDGRLGVEVWAFVPFNLLPKLRALRNGQAPGSFQFYVDGSPKLADVSTPAGWRTYLVFGEGPGGTFYQALDVTLDGMAGSVRADDNDPSAVLSFFSRADRVKLRWSFPAYRDFDCSLAPFGDLRPVATEVEKSVGQTWSSPAIVEGQAAPGRYLVLVGSGFLPPSVERRSNRFPSPSSKAAGATFYMIDAHTGDVLDSRDVGNDGQGEAVDDCAAAGDCTHLKNALQADVAAHGIGGARRITTAYVGDLDGRLWRFTIGADAAGRPAIGGQARVYDAGQPIFSSLAITDAGRRGAYIFFGTGSDRLPSSGTGPASTLVGVLDDGGTAGRAEFVLAVSGGEGAPLERVTAAPAAAGDVVFFTTMSQAEPCGPSIGRTYAVRVNGQAAYDTNHDGKTDQADARWIAAVSGARTLTPPAVADRHVLVGSGTKVDVLGDSTDYNSGLGQVRVRILSWRIVR
jgi:hypothetical protein